MGRVIVIGGGAAGMMAAVAAAEQGHHVILLEKNEKLGKKIYITGKGRCNVTNDCDMEELFDNVVTNSKFLYSAFYTFDNQRMKEYLEEDCKYARRLVIIDEADKLPVRYLEIIRAVNERCNLPFMLVGEEGLKVKTDRIPRLRSRIRNPIVLFDRAQAVDVAAYYHEAAGIDITPDTADRLVRHAQGGFRSIVNDSIAISKMSKASGLSTITENMIDKLCA